MEEVLIFITPHILQMRVDNNIKKIVETDESKRQKDEKELKQKSDATIPENKTDLDSKQ